MLQKLFDQCNGFSWILSMGMHFVLNRGSLTLLHFLWLGSITLCHSETPAGCPQCALEIECESQEPEPDSTVAADQRRDILLKAVADADRIPDERERQQAQWNLVATLVSAGMQDEAFQQALKLRLTNPQMCIYSLTTIAVDAIKRGDQAAVQKAWEAAKQSNMDSGAKHNHYVIQMGFRLKRSVAEMSAIAAAAARSDRQRAYQDIRNELAWRGRVDEAYAITAAHLSNLPKDFNDREIAFYCATAQHYDHFIQHDHLGQAIKIIKQMPRGEHREAAIVHLIDGLLYVANKETVSDERLALAEEWVVRIDDRLKQAAARAQILRHRLKGMSVEELEQRMSAVTSREEKLELLSRIFDRLLEANRIEEADQILARRVGIIRAEPRPEQKSKFGNVDDELAIRITTWTHHAAIVRALARSGRLDEARARLESMKDLPDAPPVFLVGNLQGIRQQLEKELNQIDSVEKPKP